MDPYRIRVVVKKIRYGNVPPLDLYDPTYYPSPNEDTEVVARYLIVMVAMDHRLSRPGRDYEAVINGKKHHGADLLYFLGKKKLDEDPDWFSPEHLSRLSEEELVDWLSPSKNVFPPDPSVRTRLLRDLGYKLKLFYDGRVLNLINAADNKILSHYDGKGLLNRLRIFEAYSDPVEKKSHLFTKFLVARKIFSPRDPENMRVPVDNHLTRIALRTGIVRVVRDLLDKLINGICLSEYEDVYLRFIVREAWHRVAVLSGVNDYRLDDFLWMFGRSCCTRENPVCISKCSPKCRAINGCDVDCLFASVCRSRRKHLLLNEHCYLNTYYY